MQYATPRAYASSKFGQLLYNNRPPPSTPAARTAPVPKTQASPCPSQMGERWMPGAAAACNTELAAERTELTPLEAAVSTLLTPEEACEAAPLTPELAAEIKLVARTLAVDPTWFAC